MNTIEREPLDRDPILRLDQLISRQDDMLRIAQAQLRMMHLLGVMQASLLCFALAILICVILR